MRRKPGLAALMAGGPPVVKKKSKCSILIKIFRLTGLHAFLVFFCFFYIFLGAVIFIYLEEDHEEFVRAKTEQTYHKMVEQFVNEAGMLRESIEDEETLNSSLSALLDQHTQRLFELYDNPIAINYFDSLVYRNGNYRHLWSMDQAILLTATTMVPVGFGLTTPLTLYGRMFLILYGIIGIPLALVTMSDLGRFFCNAIYKLLQENVTALTVVLLTMNILYPVVGGIWIHLVSTMSLFDSVYYCAITIFTIGFGDIDPPIAVPGLVIFIVVGVTLVTISVDIVGTNAIHHVHYWGRQMGKAKQAAAKMLQMAQKININKGLGIGMAQLGAFARMGMMIQITPGNNRDTASTLVESPNPPVAVSFEPDLELDLIDTTAGNIQMDEFAWCISGALCLMSFLPRLSTNSEYSDSSMRFRCANRSPTIVAWVFEKEPNAEFADEPEYSPPSAPSPDDIQFILVDMTIIEKLHMLNFDRYKRDASHLLKHKKIIKIDVQRQYGNVIRVYVYPLEGPMEFISCILKDEEDIARLRKIFTFILHVLEHCNCTDADIMINLGNMQSDEIDQPLIGGSNILPRVHLKQYKERFAIKLLDWQFDGPIEFYDQLKPETVKYHGSLHSPESAEDLFHNIRAQVQEENNLARRKDKYAAHFLCCIAMLCIAPILLLMVVKFCYEIEKTEESIKVLSRLFLQNGRIHIYFDNPHT